MASPTLCEVWMNEEIPGNPFICIAHREMWTITIGLNGFKFEGVAHTENKARRNIINNIKDQQHTINILESMISK